MLRILIEVDGGRIVRQMELASDQYVIGRSPDCDLVFRSAKVSRKHAFITRLSDGGYTVTDNDSRNGVFVNGERVRDRRLSNGDWLAVSSRATCLYIEAPSMGEAFRTLADRLLDASGKTEILRLQKVIGKLSSLASLDTILETVLAEAIAFVRADRGFIALIDDEGGLDPEHCAIHNIPVESNDDIRRFISRSALNRALKERERTTVPNTGLASDSLTSSAIHLNLGSLMCHPLVFSDELTGVLYVDSGSTLTHYTDVDHFYFSLLADQAAVAIENARLYDRLKKLNERLESRVEESELRYSELVRDSPDSMLVVDRGLITFSNPAALKLFEVEEGEGLIGNEVLDLVHESDRDDFCRKIKDGANFPCRFVTCRGRFIDGDVTTTATSFEGRDGTMVIIRDVTERKRVEAELLKAQKLDSISTLAGGLAHDFNNILTAILGNVSLALLKLDKTPPGELRELLEKSERGCLQARELTKQLLTFAKGGDPVKQATDMTVLIRESVELMLRGSRVKTRFDFASDLHCAEVDRGQIGQVINNIVLNALHAMPGGGLLTVRACNLEVRSSCPRNLPEGQYVVITFIDQGTGIPPDVLPRIFDPYFTTRLDGSGLGLATAYSIVKKHGGLIAARSTIGAGTEMKIYLPALVDGVAHGKDSDDPVEMRGHGRVLVMDDEEDVRELAGRILGEFGFECHFAADGEQAVRMYSRAIEESRPYRLVIMDLTIPGGMGGVQTLEAIRRLDPAAKAIVSSGYCNDPVLANHEDAGFDGVVEKPYDISRLMAEVARVLGG